MRIGLAYQAHMALTIDPTKMLFSRQQVAAATGLSDDLLAYWIKEGLLPSRSGGEGRGRPRQFGFEAIHRAAVYAELRRYNIGINGLRKLAAILDEAVQIREAMPELGYPTILKAGNIWRARRFYGSAESGIGNQFEYSEPDYESWLNSPYRRPPSAAALALVEQYEPRIERAFSIHHDLFEREIFTQKGVRWVILFDQEGELDLWPELDQGQAQPDPSLASYIVLNISRIVHRLWDGST